MSERAMQVPSPLPEAAKRRGPLPISEAMRQESLRRSTAKNEMALSKVIVDESFQEEVADQERNVSQLRQTLQQPTQEERLAAQVKAQLKARVAATDRKIEELDAEIKEITGGKSADEIDDALKTPWGGLKRFFRTAFNPKLQEKINQRNALLQANQKLDDNWRLTGDRPVATSSLDEQVQQRNLTRKQEYLDTEGKRLAQEGWQEGGNKQAAVSKKDSRARREQKTTQAMEEAWFRAGDAVPEEDAQTLITPTGEEVLEADRPQAKARKLSKLEANVVRAEQGQAKRDAKRALSGKPLDEEKPLDEDFLQQTERNLQRQERRALLDEMNAVEPKPVHDRLQKQADAFHAKEEERRRRQAEQERLEWENKINETRARIAREEAQQQEIRESMEREAAAALEKAKQVQAQREAKKRATQERVGQRMANAIDQKAKTEKAFEERLNAQNEAMLARIKARERQSQEREGQQMANEIDKKLQTQKAFDERSKKQVEASVARAKAQELRAQQRERAAQERAGQSIADGIDEEITRNESRARTQREFDQRIATQDTAMRNRIAEARAKKEKATFDERDRDLSIVADRRADHLIDVPQQKSADTRRERAQQKKLQALLDEIIASLPADEREELRPKAETKTSPPQRKGRAKQPPESAAA